MKPDIPDMHDDHEGTVSALEEDEEPSEDDLWFLPGPMGEEPDYLAPVPRAQVAETSVINDWLAAQASDAARLAHQCELVNHAPGLG